MTNELSKLDYKNMSLKQYLEVPDIVNAMDVQMGGKDALRFRGALLSAVQNNKRLAECTNSSLVTASFIGHTLGLPMSPQLGYYYLVPYKNKGVPEAQFQLGYKGYIQLAMRSGYYKRLNCAIVKKGEFVSWDPLTEELDVNFEEDPVKRENLPTVGYCGYFEYTNGFKKMVYWTREAVRSHADKYSKAYNAKKDDDLKAGKIPLKEAWKYSSFWYKDFDAMAMKTVLRQMLSKWGSMSVEMTTAFEKDVESDYGSSFGHAQHAAQETINNESGTQVVDASFANEGVAGAPVEENKIDEDWLND